MIYCTWYFQMSNCSETFWGLLCSMFWALRRGERSRRISSAGLRPFGRLPRIVQSPKVNPCFENAHIIIISYVLFLWGFLEVSLFNLLDDEFFSPYSLWFKAPVVSFAPGVGSGNASGGKSHWSRGGSGHRNLGSSKGSSGYLLPSGNLT